MTTEMVLVRAFCIFCTGVCFYAIFLVIRAVYRVKVKNAISPLMIYVYDYTQNTIKDAIFFRMKNNGDVPPENEIEFINYFNECDFYCD